VVGGVPQGTLSVFDRTQSQSQQLLAVSVPALPSTPAPLPATALTTRPITTFNSKLIRTPDGNYIVGVIPPTNAATYIFVYEVASGVILRNRTVAGSSTVLSMAPDGSASWPDPRCTISIRCKCWAHIPMRMRLSRSA
jgi:hypothetical protein